MNQRILVISSALLLLAFFQCTCCESTARIPRLVGTAPADRTTPTVRVLFNMNEVVNFGGANITVTGVRRNPAGAPEGKTYLIVRVKVENASDREITVGSLDFKAQTGQGAIIECFLIPFVEAQKPPFATLAPGGWVEGEIVFETDAGDQDVKLIYQPGWLFGSERIYFNLR